jgi:hypothetical protein
VVGEPKIAQLTDAKIARVLGGTAEHRLFVKGIRGIGEGHWPIRIGLRIVEVRVKHQLGSMPGGPADSLRIPPTVEMSRVET